MSLDPDIPPPAEEERQILLLQAAAVMKAGMNGGIFTTKSDGIPLGTYKNATVVYGDLLSHRQGTKVATQKALIALRKTRAQEAE